MRTTVELPDEVVRAAKSRAAERGESLKELFIRALTVELGWPAARGLSVRVELPLVGQAAEPRVDVTNADIEDALAAADAERYG